MEHSAEDLEWGGPHPHATVARLGCVLRTVVGSQVHGLVRAGTDDRDEMAIFIEPADYAVGLRAIEHWSHRTQPEGVSSGPGDLDLIAYSLRRYCFLALKGSPTVILPLFAPPDHVLICTEVGEELREMARYFISQRTQRSFLGYLESQRRGLDQGAGGHGRPRERELSAKHGYDTKYAMHALRIGYQGIELLNDGQITLPVPEPQRSWLMEVRMGEPSLEHVLADLDRLAGELEAAPLLVMEPPPHLIVEQWLISTYLKAWEDWTPIGLE